MVISGSVTGNTAGLGPVDEGSNPSPRAQLTVPGPCRLCGGPSWLADDLGAVHPCCLLWTAQNNGCGVCPACRASEALNQNQRHRSPNPWQEAKGVD